LELLEGKSKGKKVKGKPKRMWFDDVRQWTMLTDYGEVKRSAEDCVAWRAITHQPSTSEDRPSSRQLHFTVI